MERIPDGSTAVSHSGLESAGVNFATGSGVRCDEEPPVGGGCTGNFNPGDELLLTENLDGSVLSAPLTLTFNNPVSGVGANIEAGLFNGPSSFTALLQVYGSGGGLLGSFSEVGVSTDNEDGSAIFVAIANTPGITEAVFSLTSAPIDTGLLAINQMDVTSSPIPIPRLEQCGCWLPWRPYWLFSGGRGFSKY